MHVHFLPHRRWYACVAFVFSLFLFGDAVPGFAQEANRKWTSLDNMFSVQAALESVTDNAVKLKRANDGKLITVPLAKLSVADLAYLKTRSKPAAGDGAVTRAEFKIEGLKLERTGDAGSYLVPLGSLNAPKPGLEWKLVPGRESTFLASGPESDDTYRLSLHPPVVTNQQRKEFAGREWDAFTQKLVERGGTFQVFTLLPNTKRMPLLCQFMVKATLGGKNSYHVVSYRFMAGATIRLHHWGPKIRMGDRGAFDLLMAIKPRIRPDATAQLTPLPPEVRREIAGQLELLKRLVESEDYAAIELEFTMLGYDLSEMEQRKRVERFKNQNRVLLKALVKTLDLDNARYSASNKLVFLQGPRPEMLQLSRQGLRWCLATPVVIPNLTSAALAEYRALLTEEELAVQADPVLGMKPKDTLALDELNSEWVMFSPYGRVPIPESGFEWKLSPERPAISAKRDVVAPNNPSSVKFSEQLLVEVLPAADDRWKQVQEVSQQVVDLMKSQGIKSARSMLGNPPSEIPDKYTVEIEAGRTYAANVMLMFQADKTLLVGTVSMSRKVDDGPRYRALGYTRMLVKEIEQQTSWFPAEALDPAVRREVTVLVTKMKTFLEAENYEELLEIIAPPEVVSRWKANPGDLDKFIEDFRAREAGEMLKELSTIDWAAASYDASKQVLIFRSSKVTFLRVEGLWRLK